MRRCLRGDGVQVMADGVQAILHKQTAHLRKSFVTLGRHGCRGTAIETSKDSELRMAGRMRTTVRARGLDAPIGLAGLLIALLFLFWVPSGAQAASTTS